MNQQVNLYHPIFRRQQKRFSTQAMAQAGGIALLGIALLYVFSLWRVNDLRAQAEQIEQAQLNTVKRLEDVSRHFPPPQADPKLAEQVQRLEMRISASEQIRQILQSDLFSITRGYSDYFIAFSRQALPGLWLTGFSITGAGEHITLQGRASEPNLVPKYLERLSNEKILAGTQFQVFNMTRPQNAAQTGLESYVAFTVRTTAGEGQVRQ